MELFKAMQERRSIRKFKPDPVDRKLLEELIQKSMWAPSGTNTQPWKFVVLTEKKKEEFLQLSNLVIEAVDETLKQQFGDKMRLFIHGYFRDFGGAPALVVVLTQNNENQEGIQANYESASAAMYNLLLLAHEAGLGTCWMTGHLAVEKKVLELVGCTDYRLVGVTPIGYPDQSPPVPPRKGDKLLWLDK